MGPLPTCPESSCKAGGESAVSEDIGKMQSMGGVPGLPSSSDAVSEHDPILHQQQSPLLAIKQTGEVIIKLMLMYVFLEMAAGLFKGHSPLQHLLLAVAQLKLVLRALLAPLSMMCSGFALAMIQYSFVSRNQQPPAAVLVYNEASSTVPPRPTK